ncbi:hypothetical protein ACIHCX_03305 [Streptomyces sp. NPDC052043]|uniref:hypothetical protein n=1 Tax=Streptomyces sp. NPDC052043 TaxID=3365684 RepID=UPI0037D75E83
MTVRFLASFNRERPARREMALVLLAIVVLLVVQGVTHSVLAAGIAAVGAFLVAAAVIDHRTPTETGASRRSR